MITSYEVYQFLEIISGSDSKKVKIAFLEEFLDNSLFKMVCQYAYQPGRTYGVLRVPPCPPGSQRFTPETFYLLDDLANRKITGNAALEAISEELTGMDEFSQMLFERILKKDLRAGITAKSINKAWPGTIDTFDYMRCSTLKERPLSTIEWEEGVYSQEKLDGMFLNLNVKPSGVSAHTRVGTPFPVQYFKVGLVPASRSRLNVQLHGEVLVYKDEKLLERRTGNGLLNSLLQGNTIPYDYNLVFKAWDMIELGSEIGGFGPRPYKERFEMLTMLLNNFPGNVKVIDTRVVFKRVDAEQHFEEVITRGGEGTVLKIASGFWKNGTSRDQIKLKSERECELKVVKLLEGKGKYEHSLGSILAASCDGQLEVKVSGFTDKDRDYIWNNGVPSQIMTVRFNEVITNKQDPQKLSLFLPRFVEFRSDKVRADTAEYIVSL